MNNFLKDWKGNDSSSRLIGVFCVVWGLLAGGVLVLIKVLYPLADIVIMATASGMVFTTIAGPAMFFLFKQKQNETKEAIETKKIDENK